MENQELIQSEVALGPVSLSSLGKSRITDKGFREENKTIATFLASHAGKRINNSIYAPTGVRKALSSWQGTNLISDHGSIFGGEVESIGTIVNAEYEQLREDNYIDKTDAWNSDSKSEGAGREWVFAVLDDDDQLIHKFDQNLYSRVSIARMPSYGLGKCSSCGKRANRYACEGEVQKDSKGNPVINMFGEEVLIRHYMGEIDEDTGDPNLVIYEDFLNVHLALVKDGFSADRNAKFQGLTRPQMLDSMMVVPQGMKLFSVAKDGSAVMDLSQEEILLDRGKNSNLIQLLSDCLKRPEPGSIYPTGSNERLNVETYEMVKDLLGSKKVSRKDREKLPGNAFAGRDRTWLAHNRENVAAGLYLIQNDTACSTLSQGERRDIHKELLRRSQLLGLKTQESTTLDEKEFCRGRAIRALKEAGCLADESALQDSAYLSLAENLENGTLSLDQQYRVWGCEPVGPSGTFPVDSVESREVGREVLSFYRGPIPAQLLQNVLSNGDSSPETTPEPATDKEPCHQDKTMEFSEILDALKNIRPTEVEQVLAIDCINTAVIKRTGEAEKAVRDQLQPQLDEKTSEIKALEETLEETEATLKDQLIDRYFDLRVNGGLINRSEVMDEEGVKAKKAELKGRSIESLRDAISDIAHFGTQTIVINEQPAAAAVEPAPDPKLEVNKPKSLKDRVGKGRRTQ